jgi:hypothetical protein
MAGAFPGAFGAREGGTAASGGGNFFWILRGPEVRSGTTGPGQIAGRESGVKVRDGLRAGTDCGPEVSAGGSRAPGQIQLRARRAPGHLRNPEADWPGYELDGRLKSQPASIHFRLILVNNR